MHTSVIKMGLHCVSLAPGVCLNVSIRHGHQRCIACVPFVNVKPGSCTGNWHLHQAIALEFRFDYVKRRHGRLFCWEGPLPYLAHVLYGGKIVAGIR